MIFVMKKAKYSWNCGNQNVGSFNLRWSFGPLTWHESLPVPWPPRLDKADEVHAWKPSSRACLVESSGALGWLGVGQSNFSWRINKGYVGSLLQGQAASFEEC